MKKLSKKQKLIVGISIILLTVILAIIVTTNVINSNVGTEGYLATTANANSNLVAGYIKEGITIGGITGTLESLNTFDATATAEDIAWGETAYVKGEKITGTRLKTISEAKETQAVLEEDKTLLDDYDNKVRLPEGFKIANDSATAVEDGVVIEDKDGNQFVWIPAKTGDGAIINLSSGGTAKIVYKRTDFGVQVGNYSNYTENISTDEENSVNTWGGFYIGRFESGDKESTEEKIMRNSKSSQENKITIKKAQTPYDWITQVNSKARAEEMYKIQEYKTAFTKLVSSYAWDTAINFIQIKNSDYGKNSPEGNYTDTTFEYIDITGANKTKYSNSGEIVPTGQTKATSNIYDLGGNLWEYTTENCSIGSTPYVHRGGGASDTKSYELPAGIRGYNSVGYGNAYLSYGFRVTLYCTTN